MHDVLTLQSDIAHDVAGNIQTTITREQPLKAVSYKRIEPKAYEAYLRGRCFLAKRTAEGMNTAANYFQQAIQLTLSMLRRSPAWPTRTPIPPRISAAPLM